MKRGMNLGQSNDVDLPGGRLRYWKLGSGAPVVFVHGLLVNADIWRAVAPRVAAAGFSCVTPDLPLGSHELPMPDADLSPLGVARLLAALLEELDLRGVTLVANDTGGAIAQILMANRPSRVARVVITSSDSLERFFPTVFWFLRPMTYVPGLMWFLGQVLRLKALHRLPITFGWLSKRPIPREVVNSYLEPSRRHPAIRADLRRFLRGVSNHYTLAAAKQLATCQVPFLLAWASEDRIFPLELGQRLAAMIPRAELVPVADSYTFVPEDQPAVLADLVVAFARRDASA